MSHRIILALVILGAFVAGTQVQAEVRSYTDRYGEYVETRFLFQETQTFGSAGPNIWTPVGRVSRRTSATLNPWGDSRGDTWPVVGDSGHAPHHAWAVWSQRDGYDYELVWSRWTAGGWRSTSWIYPGEFHAGDDLDADLGFDSTGRPYLTWWREENGQGRVYLSLFLLTQWMAPYAVSEPDVDGRFPVIAVRPDGEILVTFETAEGMVEQTIFFDEPVTITDDIDPLDYISDGGMRYVGEADP